VVDGGGKIIVPTNKILEIQHQHRFKTEKGKKNTARVDGNIRKKGIEIDGRNNVK